MKRLTIEEVQKGNLERNITIIDQHSNRNITIAGIWSYVDKVTGKEKIGVLNDSNTMHCVNYIEEIGGELFLSIISFGGAYYPYEGIRYTFLDNVIITAVVFDNLEELKKYLKDVRKNNLKIIRELKVA